MVTDQDKVLALSRVKTRNLINKHTKLATKFLMALDLIEKQQKELEDDLKLIERLSEEYKKAIGIIYDQSKEIDELNDKYYSAKVEAEYNKSEAEYHKVMSELNKNEADMWEKNYFRLYRSTY